MVKLESKNGEVNISKMEGTEKCIIGDMSAAIHKVLLTMANSGAKSPEKVFVRYGVLARQLVDYIDTTVQKVDETGKEE